MKNISKALIVLAVITFSACSQQDFEDVAYTVKSEKRHISNEIESRRRNPSTIPVYKDENGEIISRQDVMPDDRSVKRTRN